MSLKIGLLVRAAVFVAAVALAGPACARMPFGADEIDQTGFALGKMRLNVIFMESNGGIDTNTENWTSAQINNIQAEIAEGVQFWEGLTAGYHPNARLHIDVNYVNGGNAIPTSYEPINRSSTQDGLWINQAMNFLGYPGTGTHQLVRDFNNDQRAVGDSNWAATVFVVNDENDVDNRFTNSFFAYAHIGGPFLVTTYGNDGWNIDRYNRVISHEMAHMFFALDEYAGGGSRTTERSGYLNGVNGNAELGPNGSPVTPPYPAALMLNNTLDPSPFTDVQIGHVDTDGDTIPDILDTFDLLTGSMTGSNPGLGLFAFNGSTTVTTIANLNPQKIGSTNSRQAMTINWVADGQYRLNGGAWTSFAAMDGDGLYDDYVEPLGFTLVGLPAGSYVIDVRDLNSVDNPSNVMSFQFVSTNPVPEPATWILAVCGVAAVVTARRRRS